MVSGGKKIKILCSLQPSVIDCDITCDIVDVKVGRGVLHTLTTSLQAWNQTLSQMISKDQAGNQRGNQTRDNNGCQPLFGHYILCNDTQQPIRFGQAGTDENLVLQPREMQEYSWRSHKMKQVRFLDFFFHLKSLSASVVCCLSKQSGPRLVWIQTV